MTTMMMTAASFGLDQVNVSFLPGHPSQTPLVVSPRWDPSLAFLTQWLQENREWLNKMLLKHGAILLRGFDVDSAGSMEKAVKAFQPNLNNTYRGTSPRRVLDNTEYVFSAAEVATHYPIAQHIEMSFLPAPPAQLYFGCLKPSASSGGETALADFRRVFADLPTDLKLKFLDKGIRYTRTHKKVGSYYTYDVSDMLGWPELFGTDSKEEVEKICKSEGIPFEWHGDTFVSTTQSPAFQLHPVTKEHVWFNHTQVFHWTTFPAELWFAFKRTWEVRLLLHCILVGIFCIIKYGILGHKMSLNSTFGDGTPITAQEMGQIRKAIHDNMVFSRWQKGDIMMIDNFSTSHGRQPTYDSGRKIAVSWSDPIVKKNEVVSLDPVLVQEEEVCMENPQEKTPESTLTKSDLATLQEQMQAKELGEKLLGHLAKRCEANSQDDFSTADLKGLFHKIEQRKMHSRSYSQPPAFYY